MSWVLSPGSLAFHEDLVLLAKLRCLISKTSDGDTIKLDSTGPLGPYVLNFP
jgi:hypothetical protein